MIDTLYHKAKSRMRWIRKAARRQDPYDIPRPLYRNRSESLMTPLLIVCKPGFKQNVPRASSLILVGFARGWADVCGPAKLVRLDRLVEELCRWEDPAVFMSQHDFTHIDEATCRLLREYKLFVLAEVFPTKLLDFKQLFPLIELEYEEVSSTFDRIVIAEPKFVWNAVGAAGMEWYSGWQEAGFHWKTIFPGLDKQRYYPDLNPRRFGNIRMAYVGGYWPEKAKGFDIYLRRWEDILCTYGYARWPYKNYSGDLDEASERQLYTTAGLIPLVTGPAGWKMAEITERYIKAPGCRGFCIADHNPSVRELFTEDELLQAECPQHFHHLVEEFLQGKLDREKWVAAGYQAVVSRHLYSHRAREIYDLLYPKGP